MTLIPTETDMPALVARKDLSLLNITLSALPTSVLGYQLQLPLYISESTEE